LRGCVNSTALAS